MKSNMKKIAAGLIALLMMIQIVPALGETYSSGMIVGNAEGYREALDIVASKGTYVLLGQTLELDVNEDYSPVWSSEDEDIATIDENGVVTAVAEGTANIIATVDSQTAKVEVTVIDPEPILTEGEPEAEGEPEGESEGEPEAEGEPEGEEESGNQTPVSSAKTSMVIVINGENERVTYDGEEHLLDRFVATGSEDSFDASKIVVTGELGVTATDCGFYELKLDELTFTYDDPAVDAHFVVNNSWLKITPAQVIVTANEASKEEGTPDPELTATVVGLIGEDTIEYTLTRAEGEEVNEYEIIPVGEELQGNYKVEYISAKLYITGDPVVTIESSIPEGSPVYKGTDITLKAVAAGFGDVELAYQWQYSTDNQNWIDIDGATASEYTYTVSRQNANYIYRVSVNPVD